VGTRDERVPEPSTDAGAAFFKRTSYGQMTLTVEGVKAIVVPVNNVEAYVVEVRSRDGQPRSETGVFLGPTGRAYRISVTH
jgi:hypothetical protein